MRVRLKGLNSKRKRLADGSFKTYWWAWKGGPPLRGELGTPEFIASYNEAVAAKIAQPPRHTSKCTLAVPRQRRLPQSRLTAHAQLHPQIILIEKDFGDFPLSAMTDRRSRGIFKAWRDTDWHKHQGAVKRTMLGRYWHECFPWSMNRGLVRRQSLRAWRPALSWFQGGEDLDC